MSKINISWPEEPPTDYALALTTCMTVLTGLSLGEVVVVDRRKLVELVGEAEAAHLAPEGAPPSAFNAGVDLICDAVLRGSPPDSSRGPRLRLVGQGDRLPTDKPIPRDVGGEQ